MSSNSRIMVPLDLSQRSARPLAYANTLAECFGAELTLMTNVGHEERDLLEDFARGESSTIADAAEAALRRMSADSLPGVTTAVMARFHASAADGILHAVGDVKADMIVMASHGRSGMSRWMLGSVAEKVLRSADVPVLVVPARDR